MPGPIEPDLVQVSLLKVQLASRAARPASAPLQGATQSGSLRFSASYSWAAAMPCLIAGL